MTRVATARKPIWRGKAASVGLADDSGIPASGWDTGQMPVAVAKVKASDLWPTDCGVAPQATGALGTGTSTIDAAIAWANGLNPKGSIIIRVLWGVNAPAYMKQMQDPNALVITMPDGQAVCPITASDPVNSNTAGTFGPFWSAAYHAEVNKGMALLGALYDSSPLVGMVHCTGAMQLYPEPCQRQLRTSGNPGGINPPTVMLHGIAGFTGAVDLATLQSSMLELTTKWPTTPISFSFNPYDTLQQFVGPYAITAQTTTDVTLSGTPPSGLSGGSGFIIRTYGRTTIDPQGLTLLTNNAPGCDFVAAGVIAGDQVWVAGAVYTVAGAGVTTKTLTMTGAMSYVNAGDNATGWPYIIWPTGLSASASYAIAGGYSGQHLNLNNFTTAPNVIGCSLVAARITQQGSVLTTMQSMAALRGYGGIVLGNQSIRRDYMGTTGTLPSLYNDLATAGAMEWYQSANDNTIVGSATGTDMALEMVLDYWLSRPTIRYIELPAGYKQYDANCTTNAGTTGTNINTTKNWTGKTWGAGTGSYGKVVFAITGNEYHVTTNSSVNGANTVTLVETLAGADASAGLVFSIQKWDGIPPVKASARVALLQSVGRSTNGRRVTTTRTTSAPARGIA